MYSRACQRVGGEGSLVGLVRGTVVDDDDAEVFVVGHHDRADGAGDDLFFVVGGDEDGDARLVVGAGEVLALAEAVDDGEEADDDEARRHEDVADVEDVEDEVVEEGEEEEGDGVGDGLAALGGVEGRHDLVAGFADEAGDGNELVAVGAEGGDEEGQGGDGDGAVAAAVVHEDDGALTVGAGLHVLELLEDGVGDLLRGFAGVFVPVVGVELVAEDGVAAALDVVDGSGLVVGVGLLVDGVGRTEEEGVDAELGAEETFGEVELEIDLSGGDVGDVGVGEGVVADLVAFAVDALHETDVVFGDLADHEEGALDVVPLEDVEDLWGPVGVGAVVEGERDHVGLVAVLLERVGGRIGLHHLFGDHLDGDGDLVVVVEGEGAGAGLGAFDDAEDVAGALGVYGVAGRD